MYDLEIKYYNKVEDVAKIWEDIFVQSSRSYFCSSQWHRVVLEFLENTFFTKKTNKLIYFSSNEVNNDTDVKVLGFFFVKQIQGKKIIQFTHLLGPSDYYDFIYTDDLDLSFIQQVIIQIIKDRKISDVSFSHVRKDSKLYEALSLFDSLQFQTLKCVSIALDDCYETHVQKLSKSVRQNLRTASNRIFKNDLVQKISFLTPNELKSIDFQHLKAIYKKRNSTKVKNIYWKTKLYNLLDDPFRKDINMFDLKAIRSTDFILGILKLDYKIAAYFFGLKNKSGIEINRVAINDDFKQYSPGMILLDEFIKVSFESGMQTIDLTVGDEKYKYDLGGEAHEIFNISGSLC